MSHSFVLLIVAIVPPVVDKLLIILFFIIVDLNGSLHINDTDVEIIDFAKVCKENKDYLGLEKGKLSAAGYEALGQILKQKLS